MIISIAITICAIELLVAHIINLSTYQTMALWQIEIVLMAAAALMAKETQRDKSIITILLFWFAWVASSDWAIDYAPPLFVQYDAVLLSLFVFWAMARPYFYPSFPLESRGENILIGFYRGTKAPLLSSLSALIGLPFSSIIIVGGVTALRPSAIGKMTISLSDALNPADYVFINTGVKGTPKIFNEIAKCSGKPTRLLGLFSAKCIRNCQSVLELLDLKPKSWFHYMPSVFYYQVARGS